MSILGRRGIISSGAFRGTVVPEAVQKFDASDITTMFTDAGTTQVTTDLDKVYQFDSAIGSDSALQTIESQRPVYRTNVQNGLSALEFTSSNTQHLDIDKPSFFSSVSDTTWVIVWKAKSSTRAILYANLDSTTGTGNWYLIYDVPTNTMKFEYYESGWNSISVYTPLDTNVVHVTTLRTVGTLVSVYHDGVLAGTYTLTTTTNFDNANTGGFRLGINGSSDALPFDGYIFENRIWSQGLSSEQLEQLWLDLDTKYGL
jgi:hypothetical protein